MDEDRHEPAAEGGDPACWAGRLPPDPDIPRAATADLARLAETDASGAAWSVETDDLDLVVFPAGDGVSGTVDAEVDVLVVGVRGGGTLEIDGLPHTLLPAAPRWCQRGRGDLSGPGVTASPGTGGAPGSSPRQAVPGADPADPPPIPH